MFGKLISAIPTPFDKDDYIDTLTLEQFLKSLAKWVLISQYSNKSFISFKTIFLASYINNNLLS